MVFVTWYEWIVEKLAGRGKSDLEYRTQRYAKVYKVYLIIIGRES